MELRDLIVTPIIIFLVYVVAYIVRPRVTDSVNRKYFFPALTVRIIGALAVGFIYQFYYDGGDTINFHTHGSRHIWEAFTHDPRKGFDVLFSDGSHQPGTFKYSSKIWYYEDPQSFFVVQVAAIIDLFTFSTYSATAVLFALISFIGAWLMFLTFYSRNQMLHKWIAVSCLFIPTVFFWGSGIFKDTLTLAAIGISLYCLSKIFVEKKISIVYFIGFIFSIWLIFSIKKYILLCFLPVVLIWMFSRLFAKIKSTLFKVLVLPVVIIPILALIFLVISTVGEDDTRYDVTKLAKTAQITAYDIRYGWGARTGNGSGYSLGELDGTWQSMVKLAPVAINVSLFRPYPWEIKNPLMFLSALESTILMVLTFYVLFKSGRSIFKNFQNPEIILCFGFSIVFAFAVGVSTYNFGSLSRYKIPLLPFYTMGLVLLYNYSNSDKKSEALEWTE